MKLNINTVLVFHHFYHDNYLLLFYFLLLSSLRGKRENQRITNQSGRCFVNLKQLFMLCLSQVKLMNQYYLNFNARYGNFSAILFGITGL